VDALARLAAVADRAGRAGSLSPDTDRRMPSASYAITGSYAITERDRADRPFQRSSPPET
jgi:hypothetical protein